VSEWAPVIAVYWALWALDGLRFGARHVFSLRAGRVLRGRLRYNRWVLPGAASTGWRITMPDVPFAISPIGIRNRPIGSAGRPAESVGTARAWHWEEIREVGVAKGWVFVNGAALCPDTGHLPAREILTLAQLVPADRERAIDDLIARWFRPTQLRRRARVLVGRTVVPAILNAVSFTFFAVLSVYVLGDIASRLPERTASAIAATLPFVLLAALAMHVAAVAIAWRALRGLRVAAPDRRGAGLFSALLLPPQALRLRALLGEGYFPAAHPLAIALAFAPESDRAAFAFNTIADLRWPIHAESDPPLAREIGTWFRRAMEARLTPLLRAARIDVDAMLAPPVAENRESGAYCPRCRDQFVGGPTVCPHGIALLPVKK